MKAKNMELGFVEKKNKKQLIKVLWWWKQEQQIKVLWRKR